MRKRSRIHILFLAWMNSFISLRVQLYSLRWIWEAVITKSNPQRGCTQNSLQTRFGLYDTPSFPLAFLMLLPPPLVWCYIFMEYLDSSWWSISTTSLSFPIPTKNMKNISTSFSSSFVNILSMPSSPSVNSGFLKSFTLGMSFLVKASPSILKPSRQSFFGFLRRSSSKSEASSVWQVIAAASLKTSPKSPNFSPTFSRKTTIPLILAMSGKLWPPQEETHFDTGACSSKPFQIFAQTWA